MNREPYQGESELEKAEHMLYQPDITIKQRSRAKLHQEHTSVPVRWAGSGGQQPPRKKFALPSSLFSKLFIGSILFFIIAAAIAIITIATSSNVSSKRINLEVLGRTFVDGGELLPLQVVIGNNNTTQIELADVVIEYPTNTGEIQRMRRSVGTIAARQQLISDFDLTLFGEEGTVVPLTVTLEYRIPDSNAILTKQTTYEVTLRSTPVVLSVVGPQSTLPNQEVTMNYTVVSNSATVVENVLLTAEYPAGFDFEKAEPAPAFSNNAWVLGDLEPGASRTISVTGIIRGNEGDTVAFKGAVGKQDPRDEKKVGTAFATIAQPVVLESTFLKTVMTSDSLQNGVLSSTGTLDVRLSWQNPLQVRITDAVIEVVLDGAYDPAKVNAQRGFYNSNTHSIIWNKDGDQNLEVLDPGESGEFTFTLQPLSGSAQLPANPAIHVSTNIKGVVEGGTVQSANSVNELTAKIASDLHLLGEVQHFTGVLPNDGPMPPKVGQQTTYTVALTVTNSSSAVTDARVVTTLPDYVTWLNVIAPQGAPVTYNPVTREVSWLVGALEPGVGYGKPSRQIAFKVGIKPSASQVGDAPNLTNDITLFGKDGYTGADLQSVRRALSTRLLNDASSVGSDGRVVQ